MELKTTFSEYAPNKVFISLSMGFIAGAAYSLLIPILLTAIRPDQEGFITSVPISESILFIEIYNKKFAALFLISCLLILIGRTTSRILVARIAMEMSSSIRKAIYYKVLRTKLSTLETIGKTKLLTFINRDVAQIVSAGNTFAEIIVNLVVSLGLLSFLAVTNFKVFIFTIEAVVFGVVTYQIPIYLAGKFHERSRKAFDDLQQSVFGLVYGIKELKINQEKNDFYIKNILKNHEEQFIRLEMKTARTFMWAQSYGELICFLIIGCIAFIYINYHTISTDELFAVIMALLYITGPISSILNSLPNFMASRAAIKNINKVFSEFSLEQFQNSSSPVPTWNEISYKGVQYSYFENKENDGFEIGPIDLEIKRGEITFLVGGNGSGKTTLSKILALFYEPTEGSIYFGNEKVSGKNIENYRQEISVIYSDFYLFESLLVPLDENKRKIAQKYLEDFDLVEKVSINEGTFSTLALSDGQRKRLALLVAILDNKNLYLFDEWAADQDPGFKEVFYKKVLPELRSLDKAIIVISHDDRYFGIADSVIYMEDGKIIR